MPAADSAAPDIDLDRRPPALPGAGPRATRREWIGLAAIALPCFVYAMDATVLNLALPAIAEELKPSGAQLLWIIDVYGFMVAGFLITMGTLGDRVGRRRVLLAGAAAFGAASALAALARSAEALIALRALLGIAGATLAPSTMSLIRNMFHDEQQRRFAIGVWIAAFSLGGAIGPLVGGVLLAAFGWRSVFLAAVPVMALLLACGPRLLPEYRDPGAGRLDPASVALSLGAVLGSVYGVKRIAEQGPGWMAVGVLAGGLALGAAFARRQRRLADPLLDLALLRQPAFAAALAAYGLSCLASYGVYVLIVQHLQLVLGLAPLHAGLALVPWSLGFAIGSLLAPRLARHVEPVKILVRGLALAVPGFLLPVLADGPHGLAALVAGTVVISLALAPVITLGNELIITAAPPERAGAASAIAETCAELSGSLGVALIGSLGAACYRAALAPSMPAGLPAEAVAESLTTLGGAVEAARSIAGPAGAALLAAARMAFTDALQLAAVVGAAAVLGASVLAGRLLRRGAAAPADGAKG